MKQICKHFEDTNIGAHFQYFRYNWRYLLTLLWSIHCVSVYLVQFLNNQPVLSEQEPIFRMNPKGTAVNATRKNAWPTCIFNFWIFNFWVFNFWVFNFWVFNFDFPIQRQLHNHLECLFNFIFSNPESKVQLSGVSPLPTHFSDFWMLSTCLSVLWITTQFSILTRTLSSLSHMITLIAKLQKVINYSNQSHVSASE